MLVGPLLLVAISKIEDGWYMSLQYLSIGVVVANSAPLDSESVDGINSKLTNTGLLLELLNTTLLAAIFPVNSFTVFLVVRLERLLLPNIEYTS